MNYGICDKHMDFNLPETGAEEDLSPACNLRILKAWGCSAVHYRAAKRMRQVGTMRMKSRYCCAFFCLGYFEQRDSAD